MSAPRRGLARPAIAVALLALVSVGAAAASPRPAAATVDRGPKAAQGGTTRVLAVGDSVMEGAAGAIPAALPGREVVVDTEVSRSTSRSVDSALAHGGGWDVVVVLLGHNDGGSPNGYQPAYRRLLDGFACSARVVLLTIHEVRSYYPVVNAFLRSEATARANVEVLDWNALVSANPGATAGDGLHLSPAGADLMAGAIARSVTQVEAEQAAATTSTAAPTTTTAPTTTAAPTTTVPPTTTAPPRTSTTTPPTTTAASTATTAAGVTAAPLVSPVPTPAAPRAPRPHTPRWAWPGVIAGTVALAAVLTREHRRRRAPGSSEPGPRPVR